MKSLVGGSNNIIVLLLLALALTVTGCKSKPEPAAPPPADTPAATQEATPEPTPEEPQQAAEPERETYRVVRGDHLWGIASKSQIYGNPYQWPLLYKANASSIQDADLIEPGQVLTVARGHSRAEIDAAVHHAKTRGAWSLGKAEQSDKDYLAR